MLAQVNILPATSQFVHTENVPKIRVCCGCTYGLGKDNTAWKTAWHCFLPLSFGSCAVFFLGSWIEEAAGRFPRSLATLHLEMDWEADPVLLITLLPSRKRAGKHREAFAEEEFHHSDSLGDLPKLPTARSQCGSRGTAALSITSPLSRGSCKPSHRHTQEPSWCKGFRSPTATGHAASLIKSARKITLEVPTAR